MIRARLPGVLSGERALGKTVRRGQTCRKVVGTGAAAGESYSVMYVETDAAPVPTA